MEQAYELEYPNEKPLFVISLVVSVLVWVILTVTIVGAVAGIFIGITVFISHGLFIAYLKGEGVKISVEQFPELHERIRRICGKLAIENVPDAYLLQQGGLLNAFVTRFVGRNFIVLYSDLVESCTDNPGALDMIIGHEIGHLIRKHLQWMWVLAPARILPLLGPAYSRACEYTCDRYGYRATETPQDAITGLAILAAGGRMAGKMNSQAYAAQREISGGFWMAFQELTNTYPFLSKRVGAIVDISKGARPREVSRNPLAYLFALFVPGGSASAGGSILVMFAVIGILAAAAIPKLMKAMDKAKARKAQQEQMYSQPDQSHQSEESPGTGEGE